MLFVSLVIKNYKNIYYVLAEIRLMFLKKRIIFKNSIQSKKSLTTRKSFKKLSKGSRRVLTTRQPFNNVGTAILIGDLEHLLGTPIVLLIEHVRSIKFFSAICLLKIFFNQQFY